MINDEGVQKYASQTPSEPKSKLWYFITRIHPGYRKITTQPITKSEIDRGIKHQQNEREIGTDNIPPEYIKYVKIGLFVTYEKYIIFALILGSSVRGELEF